jgi:hypothetical protein
LPVRILETAAVMDAAEGVGLFDQADPQKIR